MSKKYTVIYPHRRQYVSAQTEQLWLRQELKATADPLVWRYVGRPVVLRQLRELSQILPSVENSQKLCKRFLDINVIFELKDKKQRQLEETPEALAARLG